MSSDPISNYLKTTPSGQTIVYQGRLALYNDPGDEALYAATHTYLDHVENVQLAHWYNNTSEKQHYQVSYTTELQVTEGEEFSTSCNLGVTFLGLSVGTSESEKTFSKAETTASEMKTLTLTVPANSDLYFYQRKYIFNSKMTWVLDAWGTGELWNVGSQGGYHVQEGVCVTEIHAEDYVTSETLLKSSNTLKFVTLSNQNEQADATRKWENTTKKCQSTLEGIGINGCQGYIRKNRFRKLCTIIAKCCIL